MILDFNTSINYFLPLFNILWQSTSFIFLHATLGEYGMVSKIKKVVAANCILLIFFQPTLCDVMSSEHMIVLPDRIT